MVTTETTASRVMLEIVFYSFTDLLNVNCDDKFTYSADMLISGASKQISPDPPMVLVVFIRLNEETGRLSAIYTLKTSIQYHNRQ